MLSLPFTMASDFDAEGDRLNVLAPGTVDTPMLAFSIAHRSDPGMARQ